MVKKVVSTRDEFFYFLYSETKDLTDLFYVSLVLRMKSLRLAHCLSAQWYEDMGPIFFACINSWICLTPFERPRELDRPPNWHGIG